MKLIFNSETTAAPLQIANDADPIALQAEINAATVIDLHFPKFTDGRAYSQAALIRKRLGFAGELRAIGDVLVDQLQLMQRAGFSTAVMRADQNEAAAQRMLALFGDFYQGDVLQGAPHFAREAA
jgi:uncharacterized protein (DUF934 family)